MKKVNIATPVWRSKDGDIVITDRTAMNDDYLQHALNYSEHRFMHFQNEVNKLSKKIEELENLSSTAFNKSDTFRNLIRALRTEASRRGITILSLADKNPEKFEILRKDAVYQEV